MTSRHLPQRVEHGSAGCTTAQNRFVLDGRQVGPLLQRGEQGRHRDHHAGCLQSAGRPHVPTEAHAITLLVLSNVLWEGCHGDCGVTGEKTGQGDVSEQGLCRQTPPTGQRNTSRLNRIRFEYKLRQQRNCMNISRMYVLITKPRLCLIHG